MTESYSRPLRVFLCHSSGDKLTVRELYRRLDAEGWIDVWLDEEKLLPGQDWDYEIEKALDNSDAVIVTLSSGSVSKEGYVQKELRAVLDIALEKPEGTIFILPVRLEDCERPRRLRSIHGIDYFPPERREWAYQRILESLKLRATRLNLPTQAVKDLLAVDQASTSPTASYAPELENPPSTVTPKSISSVERPSEATKRKPIWMYGRLVVIILLVIGFFGPWIAGTDEQEVVSGSVVYSSSLNILGSVFFEVLIPLGFGAVFLVTLIRLLPWNFSATPALVRLERLITGIAPIGILIGLYLYILVVIYSHLDVLWGFWLSVLGIFLAPINILIEMTSTLHKGQRWPWWAWLLAFSIILPWLLLLSFWVWYSNIAGNS